MSVAAATREAVRSRPALYDALRAGIVNYTAAAESLGLDGDRDAIATALRRFAADLSETAGDSTGRSVTVRLYSNVDHQPFDTLLAVDGVGITHPSSGEPDRDAETGGRTAVQLTGEVDTRLLSKTLDRLRIADIEVDAAGVADGSLVVVVSRRDGPHVVELVESVAESTHYPTTETH